MKVVFKELIKWLIVSVIIGSITWIGISLYHLWKERRGH